MSGKTWLYSGLIIIVLAAVIIGIVIVSSSSEEITIPENDPLILMEITYPDGGEQSQLRIWDDGTVVNWQDTGIDSSQTSGDTYTRTWRTGEITATAISDLADTFNAAGFNDLDKIMYPEAILEGATENITEVSNYLIIKADFEDIDNEVMAFGYFTTSGTDILGDLPTSLGSIYEELGKILDNDTEEVLTEEVTVK